MGAYLSEPMTKKESEEGEGNKVKYGACSMQGWRVSQEDAHNCIATFDENSSLFAVYDGHGGAEVAIYLSRHLPEILKSCTAYKNGEFVKALEECYLKIDESIKTPEVLKEIQQLAKCNNSDNEANPDYEEENVGVLYEEATMPLEKLVAKYQSGSCEEGSSSIDTTDPECKPGSSKSMMLSPSGSSKSGTAAEKPTSSSAGASSSSAGPSVSSSSSVKVTEKINGECAGTWDNEASAAVPSSSSHDEIKADGLKDSAVSSSTSTPSDELIVEGKQIQLKQQDDLPTSSSDKPDFQSSKTEVSNSSDSENKPLPDEVNGGDISSANEKRDGDLEGSREATDNETPVATNGSSKSSEATAAVVSETPSSAEGTPRRKKVHPVPVVFPDSSKPERRSPRKNALSGISNFDCSDDSDDSDEDDAGYHMGSSDSDEDMDEDEDCEDEEDSDEEDDDEDEEEEEDERFLNDIQEPGFDSGSTAVVCFMKWEADSLSLWVANAGDSRCVVCREGKAVDMSHDHKPELDVEAQRIVKAGGKVTEDGRVNGGLNLSRAIGDHSYKQNHVLAPEEQMISPLPSVEHIVLNPLKDKFVVLACDGVWNSMSSQEVVDFVGGRLEKNEPLPKICEELFDTCLADDTCGDGTGCDNMTAIIVQLSNSPQAYSGSKRRFAEDDPAGEDESLKKSRVN